MLGGMFSGHTECAGEVIERNGQKLKLFYGMSSETAMKKHSGGVAEYREGGGGGGGGRGGRGGGGGGGGWGGGQLSLMRSIPLASYRNGKELGLSACESVWKELETILPLSR